MVDHEVIVEVERVWHEVPGGLRPARTNNFGGRYYTKDRPIFGVGDPLTCTLKTSVDFGKGEETVTNNYYFQVVSSRTENDQTYIVVKESL